MCATSVSAGSTRVAPARGFTPTGQQPWILGWTRTILCLVLALDRGPVRGPFRALKFQDPKG
jgi:hypothetical protein